MGSDCYKKFIRNIKTSINLLKTKIGSHFSTDPLLKGVVIIGSGTVISQALGLVFLPLITRIYPPLIYGTLAVFISLITILVDGSAFRYELAIPLPEKDEDAVYLLILSLSIVSILTFILFWILVISGDFLAGIFHFEFMKSYYWLFCFGFFGISVYNILIYFAIRSKDYVKITHTKISQSVSGAISKIILGILSFGSFGLICGEVIGRMAGIVTLGRTVLPKMWQSIKNFNIDKLKSIAKQYKRFPIFSMPASFINEMALQAPVVLLSIIFGFQVVGLYSLSYTILVAPVSFISSSMAQVFFGETSDLLRQKSDGILVQYLKTTRKLFLFGAPIILVGAVISPLLFPFIFGSAWKGAGIFSLPLSIMVIAQFVVSSTDRLELYGYNHWELAWNICRTFSVLFGFYLAFQLKLSPLVTILLYSSIMTFMYAICYILNIKAIKRVLKNEFAIKN
ncbi:MAG: oligosaccharide flippase family protein [Methanoregula sp.]|jgi:O-antigen/teichoic acid export membrane protein|uniref:lipopolysaccharide biosynthesis protein n=1 Tax=Methanoregula sp. TaxID=2052170 RepID=UPI003D11B958